MRLLLRTQSNLEAPPGIPQESYLCVVKLKKGEFEVLKDLDVGVPNPEIAMLLSPALLQRPVLATLDTPPFHHPNTQTHTVFHSKTTHHMHHTSSSQELGQIKSYHYY